TRREPRLAHCEGVRDDYVLAQSHARTARADDEDGAREPNPAPVGARRPKLRRNAPHWGPSPQREAKADKRGPRQYLAECASPGPFVGPDNAAAAGARERTQYGVLPRRFAPSPSESVRAPSPSSAASRRSSRGSACAA